MVEKRRALQAKKQRLLKGLETLMRMAPDVVATRPGGGVVDDWTDSSHGLLQQGSRRCVVYGTFWKEAESGVWGSVSVFCAGLRARGGRVGVMCVVFAIKATQS